MDPEMCISNKFLGGPDAPHPGSRLWEALQEDSGTAHLHLIPCDSCQQMSSTFPEPGLYLPDALHQMTVHHNIWLWSLF
jgi:hypothetical protein